MSTVKTTKTAKVETKAADKEVKAVKTEPVKATAAKAEVKAEVKAEPAKKAPAKVAAPKAATVKKAEPAKKAPAKKAPAKKTVAAKTTTAKKAPVKTTEEVFIEYAGSQISTADIKARVIEATGKKASAIKALNIYVQPETGKIYYTADGVTGEIAY